MVAIVATAIVSIVVSVTVSAVLIIKITAESQRAVADFMLKEFEKNSEAILQMSKGLYETVEMVKNKIE